MTHLYLRILEKEQQITEYAFKLYKKAGGNLDTHCIGRDVHKIDNSDLLKKCFKRAELKYL